MPSPSAREPSKFQLRWLPMVLFSYQRIYRSQTLFARARVEFSWPAVKLFKVFKVKNKRRELFLPKFLSSYTQQKRQFFTIIICVCKFKQYVFQISFKTIFWCFFMSGNVIFDARNFAKSVWTPTKLFYIVFIDFMALLKYNRSLCKFCCSIRSIICRILTT